MKQLSRMLSLNMAMLLQVFLPIYEYECMMLSTLRQSIAIFCMHLVLSALVHRATPP
uniref:Uncharacterized protein n=1 Tax=Setaria italica TaxID=4555 RepID=K3Z1Q4_SETIT